MILKPTESRTTEIQRFRRMTRISAAFHSDIIAEFFSKTSQMVEYTFYFFYFLQVETRERHTSTKKPSPTSKRHPSILGDVS